MRLIFPRGVEAGRDLDGPYATKPGQRRGRFRLAMPPAKKCLLVIADDGSDWRQTFLTGPVWEHVSVSLPDRCPTWEEMCWVKGLFFEPEECVVQLHPPQSEWVNNHPFCLHLWKPVGVEVPRPPRICV